MPEVLLLLVVNTALLPAGSPDTSAVNEVIASLSGSDAETLNEIGPFSLPDLVAGAVTTGARSTFVIVIAVEAVADSAFTAVNDTRYRAGRPSANVGVQVSVPAVLSAFGTNTALFPAGSPETFAVRLVIGWPSGSAALTLIVSAWVSADATVAGAVTTGAWSDAANSSAPRSAYGTGPTPEFTVEGSSRRIPPSASVAGQFAIEELAQSMAGDPPRRRKSAWPGSTNSGFAWMEWPSCPLACE